MTQHLRTGLNRFFIYKVNVEKSSTPTEQSIYLTSVVVVSRIPTQLQVG